MKRDTTTRSKPFQPVIPDSRAFRGADEKDRQEFVRLIRDFYRENRRPMPWRDQVSPYRVVVSEIMLQQTQVGRVSEKFPEFIRKFPDFTALVSASPEEVYEAWQGLGYNRRARYLHILARVVIGDHQGELPRTEKELMKLPGIGKATAGSIMAFAFNEPVVFIETNIRRVFIHHFFPGHDQVDDADILPLVGLTLDRQDPREWYYALMDYGAWLAGLIPNPNRRSRHYSRQSPFEGSDRQVRGRMLRKMIREKSCVAEELIREADDPERGAIILKTLIKEGFVCETDRVVRFVDNI